MPDWTISTTGQDPMPAHNLVPQIPPGLSRRPRRTILLTGTDQRLLTVAAQTAFDTGHQVVLPHADANVTTPAGLHLHLTANPDAPPHQADSRELRPRQLGCRPIHFGNHRPSPRLRIHP